MVFFLSPNIFFGAKQGGKGSQSYPGRLSQTWDLKTVNGYF
jgi:hypothetical protein